MARTALAVSAFTRTGTVLPLATAGDTVNGHSMVNDGRTGLIVSNVGTTVSRSVTFTIARTVDGQTVAPRVEAVAFGTAQAIGPFPVADYGSTLLFAADNAELTFRAVRF